jgi:hypothetical protein
MLFLFVAQLLVLSSLCLAAPNSIANIAPKSLSRRSRAAHSSGTLEKRAISMDEKEKEWLRENPKLLRILSRCPQTTDEAYQLMQLLTGHIMTVTPPLSKADWNKYKSAWDEADNRLLKTMDYFKSSDIFNAARNAAIFNLDLAIHLIRTEKLIDSVRNAVKTRGVRTEELLSFKDNELRAQLIRFQPTPRTSKYASTLLEGMNLHDYDTMMGTLSIRAEKERFKGIWLLVKLGCLNYKKARILFDGGSQLLF